MGYIYKIENTVDNKIYIGQTIQDLESRWKDHRKKGSNCRYLKSAIQKYGIDNFEFKLVCITFDSQLDDMEKEYIEKYDCLAPNGYNLRLGGDSGKHHEDTKRKISATLLQNKKIIQFDVQGNRLNSFNTCREAAESVGCSPSSIGHCCNGDVRTTAGYVWKYESINSDTAKNQSGIPPLTGKFKRIRDTTMLTVPKKNKLVRKIIQFDIHGNKLNSFNTCREAAEHVGVSRSSITTCCLGKRKLSKGYVWKYENQEEIYKEIISKKNRKVIQFDIRGNRLNSFNNCVEASKHVGVAASCITHCCLGNRQTSAGYVWKYENIL